MTCFFTYLKKTNNTIETINFNVEGFHKIYLKEVKKKQAVCIACIKYYLRVFKVKKF